MIKRYDHAEQTISLAAHKEICQSIAEKVRERCAALFDDIGNGDIRGCYAAEAIRTADLSDITGKD